MSINKHLSNAREYIKRGEDYYRKAGEEMSVAKEEGWSWAAIAREVERSEGWVRRVVSWATKPSDPTDSPFGGQEENEARYARHDRRKVEEIASERPEVIAKAISQAPKEVQAKIADELVGAQGTEQSLKRVAEGPKSTPRPAKTPELKLGDAVFLLWEVSQHVLAENPTGEEKVRMLGQVEAAKKVVDALSNLLDTGSLDAEFASVLAEMGRS